MDKENNNKNNKNCDRFSKQNENSLIQSNQLNPKWTKTELAALIILF